MENKNKLVLISPKESFLKMGFTEYVKPKRILSEKIKLEILNLQSQELRKNQEIKEGN